MKKKAQPKIVIQQGNLTVEEMAAIEANLAKVMLDVTALKSLPQIAGASGFGKMATLAEHTEKLVREVKLLRGW